jgi:CheY-like chemotaxis protein
MLWLPEVVTETGDAESPLLPPAVDCATAERIRILLVDDEAMIREILAHHLQDAGYDVLRAASGAEALALAETEKVDGLITDLSMPGMDGLAVIRGLQQRDPSLPAVLLTGYVGDEAALAMNGAITGTFSLLRKPVSEVQLIDRLHALLAARADNHR